MEFDKETQQLRRVRELIDEALGSADAEANAVVAARLRDVIAYLDERLAAN
ncbi:hypothetical protein U1701_00440 [Sphingomonas sp. PB2P19]|uniref:hypothetical protein n=1 Tax=Sphingomonas rhamnosi TaxID=3096156 RepID=UPI002FC91557